VGAAATPAPASSAVGGPPDTDRGDLLFQGHRYSTSFGAMPQPAATTRDKAFLVERYWPGVDEEVLRAALPRLEISARAMTAEGHEVRHVGSFLMPADQVVISVISAESETIVREVNERAAMPVDRIARVTSYGFGAEGRPHPTPIVPTTEPTGGHDETAPT
jgi:hypothetical protein